MEITTKGAEMESQIQVRYEELKLIDKITPGRTPWQTLLRQAEQQILTETSK